MIQLGGRGVPRPSSCLAEAAASLAVGGLLLAGCRSPAAVQAPSALEGGGETAPSSRLQVEVKTDSPPVSPEGPADRILYPAARRPEQRFLERADGRITKFYPTKPQKAAKIAGLLKTHLRLAEEQVSIEADYEKSNVRPKEGETLLDHSDLVIVTGTREEIHRVDQFIDMVEARMPVIEIDARIVEITTNKDFQFGIEALLQEAKSIDANGNPVNDPATLFTGVTSRFDTEQFLSASTARSDFSGSILDLRAIKDKLSVELLIQALQKNSNAEILSAPKVAVLNGYSAEIITGTEVPIQSAQLVGSQTFLNVSFKQTGIALHVTPYVINKDTVQLVVAPEVSAVTGFTQAVRGGFSNPIFSTRNARTVVNIRDGATYIIGGLISSSDINDEKKTPLLGDIPLIKYLFRATRTQKVYSQLIFFITPKIISSGSMPPPTVESGELPR